MTDCKHCGDPLTRDRGEWVDPTDGDVCSLASGDAGHNLPHAPEASDKDRAEHVGRKAAREQLGEGYVIVENTPGYLPDTEATVCDTFGEALDVAEDMIRDASEYLQGGDTSVPVLVDRYRNVDTIGGECFAAYVRTESSYSLGRWISIDPASDYATDGGE